MPSNELKEWIRNNLILEVAFSEKYGHGNDMDVSLRFKDEEKPFSYGRVSIPDIDNA